MGSYTPVESTLRQDNGSITFSSNQNSEREAGYDPSLYMNQNFENTIWSAAPRYTMLLNNWMSNQRSGEVLRRNVSVPFVINRNRRDQQEEPNSPAHTVSVNRYQMPSRQLSVPAVTNVTLSNRQSEIFRIHQELARYHNSLQSRIRNSPRFVYHPSSSNGPVVTHNASTQPNNGGRNNSNNNRRHMNVIQNYYNNRRRNSSINTRNFSINDPNSGTSSISQLVSRPTQTINLVDPDKILLPPEIIESFPVNTFEENLAGSDQSNNSCSVCLEDYVKGDEIKRLPCTHFYHKNCIDGWLKRSTRCPICKFDYILILQI